MTEQHMATLEGLIKHATVALQDLVAAVEGNGSGADTATALQDLVDLMGKRTGTDLAPLVKALSALRIPAPVVQNHIQPAAVQLLPAPALQPRTETWNVQLFGEDGKPRGRMAITKTTTPQIGK
jgi:hypothetical protein